MRSNRPVYHGRWVARAYTVLNSAEAEALRTYKPARRLDDDRANDTPDILYVARRSAGPSHPE
jgi:hypothetical protein